MGKIFRVRIAWPAERTCENWFIRHIKWGFAVSIDARSQVSASKAGKFRRMSTFPLFAAISLLP